MGGEMKGRKNIRVMYVFRNKEKKDVYSIKYIYAVFNFIDGLIIYLLLFLGYQLFRQCVLFVFWKR